MIRTMLLGATAAALAGPAAAAGSGEHLRGQSWAARRHSSGHAAEAGHVTPAAEYPAAESERRCCLGLACWTACRRAQLQPPPELPRNHDTP